MLTQAYRHVKTSTPSFYLPSSLPPLGGPVAQLSPRHESIADRVSGLSSRLEYAELTLQEKFEIVICLLKPLYLKISFKSFKVRLIKRISKVNKGKESFSSSGVSDVEGQQLSPPVT